MSPMTQLDATIKSQEAYLEAKKKQAAAYQRFINLSHTVAEQLFGPGRTSMGGRIWLPTVYAGFILSRMRPAFVSAPCSPATRPPPSESSARSIAALARL